MEEVGARTESVRGFLREVEGGAPVESALGVAGAPEAVRRFVTGTVVCATTGSTVEVAAAFLFGREDVIPEMFERLLKAWKGGEQAVPHFAYYLRRHIEVDSASHGPLAEQFLVAVCGEDEKRWLEAATAARRAIENRIELWDRIREEMR